MIQWVSLGMRTNSVLPTQTGQEWAGMLTPSGWKPVTARTSAHESRRWKWPATLLTAIFSAIPLTTYSQQTAPALASPPDFSFNPGIQLPLNAPTHPIQQIPFSGLREGQTVNIQQVQSTAQAARSVHRLIDSLPTPVDELEVVERRHQYMTTKAHVNRIAIGDPSILDIVQYSQKEFSLMGLARGTTSLTIWFEGETEPLIYTVKTVADPNLDNQRKLDYGRLERKLAQMYPNSKVYLIPMSRKIIVRGQARDQEEAAHILNIVRGEVINQEGASSDLSLTSTVDWPLHTTLASRTMFMDSTVRLALAHGIWLPDSSSMS